MTFHEAYEGTPPWDIGDPQPDMAALVDGGAVHGRVLDLGCGTGENALYAARHGARVVGVDLVPAAVRKARRKSEERGVDLDLVVADAGALPFQDDAFDSVLDSGVFHVFTLDQQAAYVAEVGRVTRPAGDYHVLVFSDEESEGWGPRRITKDELRTALKEDWTEKELTEARYLNRLQEGGAAAWRGWFSRGD